MTVQKKPIPFDQLFGGKRNRWNTYRRAQLFQDATGDGHIRRIGVSFSYTGKHTVSRFNNFRTAASLQGLHIYDREAIRNCRDSR
jgi:hypothetical protein